jgi:osmotically-inducible protein OsmY
LPAQPSPQGRRRLDLLSVQEEISAGVATLWGGVSTTEHIEIAGRLASEVEGIGCVNNFLKVGPPEGPDGAAPPPG